MIVRPRPHWLRMLFVLRGSVLPDIAPQLVAATGFAVLVAMCHGQLLQWKIQLTFVPFSLIGLTLAIFLGFRNSTSYARYWEARMLWGVLLNDTRSLVRQALTHIDDPSHTRDFAMYLIAFVHALRHQLRGSDPSPDLRRLLSDSDCVRLQNLRYKPAALLLHASHWVREKRQEGVLSPVLVPVIESSMTHLCDALGGCERIANTPIPFTYSVLIHRTVFTYCLLLPFGLVDSIGAMTPVVAGFIAYTFFALEAVAAEIEEPFGMAPNDLALDAMSSMIEESLREMLGEQLPEKPDAAEIILT
ncbi:bestrophin family ion channel (plasmid) [Acidovorax sp. A79]|uniref:bestrophin family protein n=1 Tax=Acidovorax sp. A79 TaxID=3056107 RepID=UPI0034E860A5